MACIIITSFNSAYIIIQLLIYKTDDLSSLAKCLYSHSHTLIFYLFAASLEGSAAPEAACSALPAKAHGLSVGSTGHGYTSRSPSSSPHLAEIPTPLSSPAWPRVWVGFCCFSCYNISTIADYILKSHVFCFF